MSQPQLTAVLRQIADGLPENARMPNRRDLCAELKVTPFALQESFRQLEYEGRVAVVRGKGTFARKGAPKAKSFVQIVYLDHSSTHPSEERGLGFLSRSSAAHGLDCHVAHVTATDVDGLRHVFAVCSEKKECYGVVIAGGADESIRPLLESLRQPFVLFGDVLSDEAARSLPIITNDCFHGALLSVRQLLARGCTRIVLLNFSGNTDTLWMREAHAGVAAAIESDSGIEVLFPEGDTVNLASLPELEDEVREWLGPNHEQRVGILCRDYGPVSIGAVLCRALRTEKMAPTLACMSKGLEQSHLVGPLLMLCSMEARAEAIIQRLGAMRRGVDSPGRRCVPYEVIEDHKSAVNIVPNPGEERMLSRY